MRYCKIENGVITKYNQSRKDFGVGENSDEQTCIDKGYYILLGNPPSIDSATQRIGGSSYVIDEATKTVEKVYTVIGIPIEELIATKNKLVETTVQNHINDTVVARGYDNENSIAKYLTVGNVFYAECVAISLWIGNVWAYIFQVQTDILAGVRTEPTIKELILELPKLV